MTFISECLKDQSSGWSYIPFDSSLWLIVRSQHEIKQAKAFLIETNIKNQDYLRENEFRESLFIKANQVRLLSEPWE